MQLLKHCCISIMLAFFLGGCLPKGITARPAGSDFAPQQMTEADFKAETARLAAITEKSKTVPNEKAEAHRRLAIIYLSPGNPQQDHGKALAELGKYLSLDPGKLDRSTVANWVKAIESAKEHEQTRKRVAQLEKKNRGLEKTIAKLQAQKTKLEKTIEQLKNLDLSLEKKRKNLQ